MGLKFREDLYLRGLNFAIFFFHNREKREIKDRQTRTLKGNEKKFELSAIRLFFFSGLLVIVLQYSSEIPVACPQTPRTSSRSGLVVALRARSRALADVFEKNEQKNKTASVHRVHRKDMLAA